MVPKEELEACQMEIERLQRGMDNMVTKSVVDLVKDQVAAAELQVSALSYRSMVFAHCSSLCPQGAAYCYRSLHWTRSRPPKVQTASHMENIQPHRIRTDCLTIEHGQAERCKKLLEGTVPKTEFDMAEDQVRAQKEEVSRLRKLVDSMVAPAKHQAAQDQVSLSVIHSMVAPAKIRPPMIR